MIVIKEVQNKKDLKKFVKFPIELYKNNPYFVPGLIQDEIDEFTPEKTSVYFESAKDSKRPGFTDFTGEQTGKKSSIMVFDHGVPLNFDEDLAKEILS